MAPSPTASRSWLIQDARTGLWRAQANGRGQWRSKPQATLFPDREQALDALAALSPEDFRHARLVEQETLTVSSTDARDLLPTPPDVRSATVPLADLRAAGDWRAETHLALQRR